LRGEGNIPRLLVNAGIDRKCGILRVVAWRQGTATLFRKNRGEFRGHKSTGTPQIISLTVSIFSAD